MVSFQIGKVLLPSTIANRTFLAWIRQQDPTDKMFYNVEQFSGMIVHKMSFGGMKAVVTPSTLIAYENTVYTFSITPDHAVELNGLIVINYPKNITIPDPSFSQSQCRGFVGFPTTPTCVINPVARTITINNGFRTQSTTTGIPNYQF